MIDDSLTIIVPTIGRGSLKFTLDSIAKEIGMFDQVFIVGDGIYPMAKAIVDGYGMQYAYFELPDGPHQDWGARARNFAIPISKKGYIAFMDDDDCYLPSAFASIRIAIQEHPGKPLIFKMLHGNRLIWERQTFEIGNVSSQMVVLPNRPDKIGRFSERYEGDFDFIKGTADLYGDEPFVWRHEIISILIKANGKPDESPIRSLELPADQRNLHRD